MHEHSPEATRRDSLLARRALGANCYLGRSPLITSGSASGANDFAEAVRAAVVNKGAGGMGLISGRKAFERPLAEGIKMLNLIQDVYLDGAITIA